jgi:hypothetical protein
MTQPKAICGMNKDLLEKFENEGKLFARYWLSSKMMPDVSEELFERFIEPHFTLLLQGWEDKNRALYPEVDEDIHAFMQKAPKTLSSLDGSVVAKNPKRL